MKKKTVVFLTSALVSLLFIVAPIQPQVSAQSPEESIQSTQTRTVTQTRVYGINQSIPSSIQYNVGGWNGTLYRINTQSTGDHILANFRGTVSCSGICALPSKLEELN